MHPIEFAFKMTFVVGVIGLLLVALSVAHWSGYQGPPSETYSFTDIEAQPEHKLCIIPLALAGVGVFVAVWKILGMLWKPYR
jgi:hypothetical protein